MNKKTVKLSALTFGLFLTGHTFAAGTSLVSNINGKSLSAKTGVTAGRPDGNVMRRSGLVV